MKLRKEKMIWLFLFAIYAAAMIVLLFYRDKMEETAFNNVPFKTIRLFTYVLKNTDSFQPGMLAAAVVNIAGNVLVFVPYGFFLPKCFGCRKPLSVMLVGFLTVALIEGLQYMTEKGVADIDDLILNVPGIMAGYLIYCLCSRNRKAAEEETVSQC